MPDVSVVIITKNEADHVRGALESVRWADDIVVVDSGSTDDTVGVARQFTDRVVSHAWQGYGAQKNYATSLATHDWVLSLDADERLTTSLAEEIRTLLHREPPARGYRIPRVTRYLGRWIRSTDWYPDRQLRLYDRRAAAWSNDLVHESVVVRGPIGQLRGELQHHAYRDMSHHLETIDRYTSLAARQMHGAGRRTGWPELAIRPPLAFLRNYLLRGGVRDGVVGLIVSGLNTYYVFLKLAKLWAMQHAGTGDRDCPPMFSLHVDTAHTWRGGQNQVLLTVGGLRARGHRAGLVARPRGALYRRAADRLDAARDCYPLDPRGDWDVAAAWRLARLVRRLDPDILHAHDAHAVAMSAMARRLGRRRDTLRLIVSRRVDFHVGANIFSRWKYLDVDRFICASDAIRRLLVDDGIPAHRAGVVHEGIDLDQVRRAAPIDLRRELGFPPEAPVVGNVAALVPHKGQRHLVEAAALVARAQPETRFVIVGAGELAPVLTAQIRRLGLEQRVILTGFRDDVPSVLKALDLFVMPSVTEGLGTTVLDAMAAGLAVVGTRAGGIPESVVDGTTGLLVPTADAPALAHAMLALLADPGRRRALGAAGRARAERAFSAARMVDETAAVYAAQVGTTLAAGTGYRPAAPETRTVPASRDDTTNSRTSPGPPDRDAGATR